MALICPPLVTGDAEHVSVDQLATVQILWRHTCSGPWTIFKIGFKLSSC